MKRKGCARCAWLVLMGCLVASCDEIGEPDLQVTPDAQVVLQISAGPEVARQTAFLRIQFAALPALPEASSSAAPDMIMIDEPRRIEFAVSRFPQPVRVPDDLLLQGAAFWVEVSALDVNRKVRATVRLISAQQAGFVLEPALVLSDVCLNVICGLPTYTCSASGFCARAVRAPEGLAQRPLD